jgi:hypothetical protein
MFVHSNLSSTVYILNHRIRGAWGEVSREQRANRICVDKTSLKVGGGGGGKHDFKVSAAAVAAAIATALGVIWPAFCQQSIHLNEANIVTEFVEIYHQIYFPFSLRNTLVKFAAVSIVISTPNWSLFMRASRNGSCVHCARLAIFQNVSRS